MTKGRLGQSAVVFSPAAGGHAHARAWLGPAPGTTQARNAGPAFTFRNAQPRSKTSCCTQSQQQVEDGKGLCPLGGPRIALCRRDDPQGSGQGKA